MIWVGIGSGVGIGILLFLAFWLGQRSASIAQAESREVVPSTDPPVIAQEADDAPDLVEASEPEQVYSSPAAAGPTVEEFEGLPKPVVEVRQPIPQWKQRFPLPIPKLVRISPLPEEQAPRQEF